MIAKRILKLNAGKRMNLDAAAADENFNRPLSVMRKFCLGESNAAHRQICAVMSISQPVISANTHCLTMLTNSPSHPT
jgi:hypothetical protein